MEPLPGFEPGAFWSVARRSSVKLQGRGAYHRNRTDIIILEGCSSTIELGGHIDRTSRGCRFVGLYFRARFPSGRLPLRVLWWKIVCICCKSTVDITEAGLEPALPQRLHISALCVVCELCFNLFGIGTR